MPIDLILAMPLEIRVLGLALLGMAIGSLLNLGIYRLAWASRSISPWSAAPKSAPPRGWLDRVPVVGWLRLRREANLHGSGFWVRPLLIELGFGLGIAWLYLWLVVQQGQYALLFLPHPIPAQQVALPPDILHWQFLSQSLLIALMVVATFIDIDEKTIPDGVTLTGTVLALLLAATEPHSLLGQLDFRPVPHTLATEVSIGPLVEQRILPDNRMYHEVVTLATPHTFPSMLHGRPRVGSLALGLGCYWLWCFAFAPRPWYPRHGLRRALRIATARLVRSLLNPLLAGMIAAGSVAVTFVWWIGGDHWIGLITALVGMAASGGIVWLVRIIGAATLRKEAMGFGDVLLMMMIGAFVGWQAGILVFFLAPIAGLLIGVIQLVFSRDQYIPYGPFLCLATTVVLVRWADIWLYTRGVFDLGLILPGILLGCMALMAILLALWQMIKDIYFGWS